MGLVYKWGLMIVIQWQVTRKGLELCQWSVRKAGKKVTTRELDNKGQLTMEIATKYDLRDRFKRITSNIYYLDLE